MSDPISVLSVVSKYGTPPPSLWTLAQNVGMSAPVSVKDLMDRLEPARYSISMPSFRINMMRSGAFGQKVGSDTDYVSMSVKVGGQIISPTPLFVGDHSGGVVPFGLSLGPFTVLATDEVYFQYSIINFGGPPSDAVAFLEKVASQLLSAGEEAYKAAMQKYGAYAFFSKLTPQEQDAFMGAQLGFELGLMGVVLPGLGVLLGLLAGWYKNIIWGFMYPKCDGPVAAALYVFSPARLRELTKNGTQPQVDKNLGKDSAQGCGANSDYDVTWTLSKC